MDPLSIALAGLLDILLGDPRRLPHPVRWIGRLIGALERLLYPTGGSPRAHLLRGALLCAATVGITAGAGWLVLAACRAVSPVALVAAETVIGFYCLSIRSLAGEAMRVLHALRAGDIVAARAAVAMIVGRDTQELDDRGVSRATVETIAENITDGIVSPLFFLALGGPIAALAFKAASTMDSMIGYRNDRHRHFGACAARLDDILNWVPARLTAFVLLPVAALLAGANGLRALRVAARDRLKHLSPNAAHGEAAVAGALNVQLGGPSTYNGVVSHKPILHEEGAPTAPRDITRAANIAYATAAVTLALAVATRVLLQVRW